MREDDDRIADPSEFLFIGDNYSPELFMKTLLSISKNQANTDQVLKAMAEQGTKTEIAVEKLADTMQQMVLSHNDTKKDIEAINARVDDRKDENKKHTQLIEKLFDKVEKFDNELHQSCDLYNTKANEYTDKEINKLIKYVAGGAVIAVGLIAIIFVDMQGKMKRNDEHTRNTKIHIKADK